MREKTIPSNTPLTGAASWLINAGSDDMQRILAGMTGTPEDIAALRAAIDSETARPTPRVTRLKPIQAKLQKFSDAITAKTVAIIHSRNTGPTAKKTPIEILADEVVAGRSLATPAAPSITELNSLHQEATTAADQAKALGEFATRKAIILGLKLAQLKEATPHGQWEALFSSGAKRVKSPNANHGSHLLKFDSRTGAKYIAVAANLMAQRLSSEQSAALMQLASSPTEATQDLKPAEIQFLEDLMPERSLRHLYINLGIIKPTVREARAMEELPQHVKKDKKLTPPTLAEIEQFKKDHARKFWFGTVNAGMVEPDAMLHMLMDEARDPIKAHLRQLSRQDLMEVQETLQDVLKITRLIIANH